MSDMPMPQRGKIWDPARDSKISIMSEAAMTKQHRREIIMLAQEMGVQTLAQQEAAALKANMRRMTPISDAELPKHAPVAQTRVVPEVVKLVKAKKEPKPKRAAVPAGYLTIGELCDKWKIKPLHARTCLRASDLEKPAFGWAFSPKDIPNIKKLCGVK